MAEYWAVRSITSSRPSIGLPASSNTSMPTSSDFATVLACLSYAPVEPKVRAWLAASTVGIHTCLPPSWSAASTAAGLIPPTARLSTIPPTTWIPGTCCIVM